MKIELTPNGVLLLYSVNSLPICKVQVLYKSKLDLVTFIRVADPQHLSPIMAVKMKDTFLVGDVLWIKKVKLMPCGFFSSDKGQFIVDSGVMQVMIVEYSIVERKSNVHCDLQAYQKYFSSSGYWNSLLHVKSKLVKINGLNEAFFIKNEKRLKYLQHDCQLLREKGNEYFKDQFYSKAILHYDMAKQKDCFDARVWNNSSQAFYFNNEYEKAKNDAFVALKLDPFNKKAYFRAGRALECVGDVSGAAEAIESGLYVCGHCDDLEKLLNQIKGSKKDENQNILNNSKKKNVTNISSISVENTKKQSKQKDFEDKKNRNNELKHNSNSHLIDSKKHNSSDNIGNANNVNTPVASLLVGAKMLYEKGKFKNALELYEVSLSILSNKNKRKEHTVVCYLMEVCRWKLKSESVEVVLNSFLGLLSNDAFPFQPAVHYWLSFLYKELDDQDKVDFHANSCYHLIEKGSSKYNLTWPGTKDPISETSPEQLKSWFSEGSWRSSPLAKCRNPDCLKVRNDPLAKTEIYGSDFDFRGYVEVVCQELCSIPYHPCCWKFIKEQSECDNPNRTTDKDLLDSSCLTPDCAGKVLKIKIFDETNNLRNEVSRIKKDVNAKVKLKKNKAKKVKSSGSQTKSEEKKKTVKSSDAAKSKIEESTKAIEETATKKEVSGEAGKAGSIVDFEAAEFRVLRPNDEDDAAEGEFCPIAKKKPKTKKKKKQLKQLTQIQIPEADHDQHLNNEYLQKLRSLRLQRDQTESSEATSNRTATLGNVQNSTPFLMDPERPFYLPEHLQNNLEQLESLLQSKMVSVSSSDLDATAIDSLLEFMYDWLKAHTPMMVGDARLKNCVSENFPPNAVAHVNKCGGIRQFLLQSFKFAVVDDVIGVSEHVMMAQETAVSLALQKFKSPKYLISDNYKASKFCDLLNEDAKSAATSSSHSLSKTSVQSSGAESFFSTASSVPPRKENGMAAVTEPPRNVNGMDADRPGRAATSYKMAAQSKINHEDTKSKTETLVPNLNLTVLKPEKTPKKKKLKTMDMDAFEEIESSEICNLFTLESSPQNEKTFKASNSVSEVNTTKNAFGDNQLSMTAEELARRVSSLERELASKNDLVASLAEENARLTSQNEDLSDKMSRVKSKSAVEITALKKSVEEAKDKSKVSQSNLDSYKNQRDGEFRKLTTEKAKGQEELKSCAQKLDSLQLTIDQLRSQKTQSEEELDELSMQLLDQVERYSELEKKNGALLRRSREAESKYLAIKRDLIVLYLEKTKNRLKRELDRVSALSDEWSDGSVPSKATLERSEAEWSEAVSKIGFSVQAVTDECSKLMNLVEVGCSLSSLPPGDLQIPSIPELSLVHLLFLSKTSENRNLDSNPNRFAQPPPNFASQIPTAFSAAPNSIFRTPEAFSAFEMNPYKRKIPLLDTPGRPPREPTNDLVASLQKSVFGLYDLPPKGHFSANERSKAPGGGFTSEAVDTRGSASFGYHSTGSARSSPVNSPASFGLPSTGSARSSPVNSPASYGLPSTGSARSSPSLVPSSSPSPGMLASVSTDGSVGTFPASSKFTGHSDDQIFSSRVSSDLTEDNQKPSDTGARPLPLMKHSILGPGPALSFASPGIRPRRVATQTAMNLEKGPESPATSSRSSPLLNRPRDEVLPALRRPGVSLLGDKPEEGGQVPNSLSPSTADFGIQNLLTSTKPSSNNSHSMVGTTNKLRLQNLRSSSTPVGAFGALPPKVVRPNARGTPSSPALAHSTAGGKEEVPAASSSYRRLVDECKAKFGQEYNLECIQKAIKDVREQNKNTLSGLQLDTIMERVEKQLRSSKKKPSVAPWAQLTMAKRPPGSSLSAADGFPDDHCAICLELLTASAKMPLPCKHVFHVSCIKSWLSRKSDCPICRKFALNCDEFPSLDCF